ncbi:MAG: hypothetical protein DRI57_24335 [Deltaproteobacteria bacterium]|nr:MAG: hypothetical protein DRI57_24335 [Deltaproteobacteria bacterium]
MRACTRCEAWHTEAEKNKGHYLSCTQVKEYWAEVNRHHKGETGHYAQIHIRKDGRIICLKCGQDINDHL